MKKLLSLFFSIGLFFTGIETPFNNTCAMESIVNSNTKVSKPKVVAVVPIKMNNQRCPGKNTKSLSDGTPLIHCILKTLKQVNNIDEIYVYCSNEDIKQYLIPGIKFLKRSEKLDSNTTSINEVLSAFANDIDSDIYVLSHATAPFIRSETIQDSICQVIGGLYDSALAVKKLNEFLWKDGKPLNYDPKNIPRTQDLETIYSETSGLYVFKKDLIKLENRRVGHNPYLKEVGKIEAVDIDDPEDFTIAGAVYDKVFKDMLCHTDHHMLKKNLEF
ncbi:MAG: hypothetical protein RUMPE_00895 [Eubacteriales bacterium SKADARSKE-1]|nr:hypothetical protein [Eubacteriales bacterium SKADARSKE-1]